MAYTTQLKRKAYGAQPRIAEQVYRDLFADAKIECPEAPEYRNAGDGAEEPAVFFTVAANDLDNVYDRVIIPAQSQLRALKDYEAVPDRAPVRAALAQKTTVVVNVTTSMGLKPSPPSQAQRQPGVLAEEHVIQNPAKGAMR